MSTTTIDKTLRRLRHEALSNSDIAEALEFLADGTETEDPFAQVDQRVVTAVRAINRRRQLHRRAELRDRSLTTTQVVSLIASISDRKGVDRRRKRGRLLGVKESGMILHPIWQFDADGGDTRPGLDVLLAALFEVTSGPAAGDAVMTMPRNDLDGRSIADLFAAGRVELAVQLIRMAGDQS
ncbi:MAG: hypothetical protein M3083_13815 [Actinomycetota bacterium]|nr:hypothetical protein [Actinomycetota bacterium]